METKEKNRKGSWIAVAMVIVLAATGVFIVYSQKENQIDELLSQNSSVNAVLAQRDSVVNELVSAFDEIEQNLDSIKIQRNQLALIEQESGKNKKDRIVDAIKQLNSLLETNSRNVSQLQSKLKRSGIEVNSFKVKLAKLTHNMDVQNAEIAELKKQLEDRDFTISELNLKMASLEDQIASASDSIKLQKESIKNKDNQINTAYVALGTSQELKEKGLLSKERGFLNIGGSKTLNKDFDADYFVQVDKREINEIPINSKKVKMISEHPDSSYRLVEEGGLITALEIENPDEFWKISKYALIEIK